MEPMAEIYVARFPRISSGSDSWSLPLFEPAAWSLVEVLLSDKADRHYEHLLESASLDASLTLWAVCEAGASDGRELHTLADVARWLLTTGIRQHLRWTDEQLGSPPAVGQATWDRWSNLASVSVGAVDPFRQQDDAAENEASLLALVHNAGQWLEACIDPRPEAENAGDSKTTCLPPWLADQLRPLDQEPPADPSHGKTTWDQGEPATARAGSSQLATVFPALIQRLLRLEALESDFADQLRHEKLLAMKELAYGAGHEINNPLANISSRAQTLLRSETDADNRRKLATINAQAFRAHEMIANMMLFAKPPALELAQVRLDQLIDEVIDQLRPTAQLQETVILYEQAPSLPELEADAVQLKVALTSICTNSLEAIGLGGQIRIGVDLDETDRGSRAVIIRIHDTGPGISPHARRHLFDPFFSGREAGRGLGFGLSKAWTIVTLHGGEITVDSDMDPGATFRVRLPTQVPESARHSKGQSGDAPAKQ